MNGYILMRGSLHNQSIAQKHLVREKLLIPSLQIKVDNLQKREEYLEALDEINDMLSSGHESEAESSVFG